MGEEPEVVRNQIEQTRDRMSDTLAAIEDRVSPSAMANRRRARVRVWVGNVRSTVMGTAESVTAPGRALQHGTAEQARHLGEAVSDLPSQVGERTQGSPVLAGVLAFGAGMLVATVLPPTEQERQLAEQVQPQVAETAAELQAAAKLTAESARQTAADEAIDLREHAKDAGQTVTDRAKEAAQGVAGEARQHAEQVRGDLQP